MPYSTNRRAEADQYLTAQRTIIANHFSIPLDQIEIADDSLDMKAATDFVVGGLHVSGRVRKAQYMKWADQFTIRIVEMEKIKRGLVHLMLYGFGDGAGNLIRWNLFSLAPLRQFANDDFKCLPHEIIREGDAEFYVFRYADFPAYPTLILASSDPIPTPSDEQCDCRRQRSTERFMERTGLVPILPPHPLPHPPQALDF